MVSRSKRMAGDRSGLVIDEPSTVRVVGSWGAIEKGLIEEPPVDTSPLEKPLTIEPHDPPPLSPEPLPSRAPSSTVARRQQIIDEGADLAAQALDLFNLAVDTIGIVDINAHNRYGELLKRMASTVEELESKL